MKLMVVEQMRSQGNPDRPFAVEEAIRSHRATQFLENCGRQCLIRGEQVVVFANRPIPQGPPNWCARLHEGSSVDQSKFRCRLHTRGYSARSTEFYLISARPLSEYASGRSMSATRSTALRQDVDLIKQVRRRSNKNRRSPGDYFAIATAFTKSCRETGRRKVKSHALQPPHLTILAGRVTRSYGA
jgi:hypothetical protein